MCPKLGVSEIGNTASKISNDPQMIDKIPLETGDGRPQTINGEPETGNGMPETGNVNQKSTIIGIVRTQNLNVMKLAMVHLKLNIMSV